MYLLTLEKKLITQQKLLKTPVVKKIASYRKRKFYHFLILVKLNKNFYYKQNPNL